MISPLLPFLGVLASFIFFKRVPEHFESWAPLIRYLSVNVGGLLTTHWLALEGLKHQGPGLLGTFFFFLLYGLIELIFLGLATVWAFSRVVESAPASAHIGAVKYTLIVAGILSFIWLGGSAFLRFLDSRIIGKGKGNLLAGRSLSREVKISAVDSDRLNFRFRVVMSDGWGPGRHDLIVEEHHRNFFQGLFANPATSEILGLPGTGWSLDRDEATVIVDPSAYTYGEYTALVEKMNSVARVPLIPWQWIREAYDRSRVNGDFSSSAQEIVSHYIARAELIDEKKSDEKIAGKLGDLKSGNHQLLCDEELLSVIRYDSFLRESCAFLKLARSLPKNNS